MKKVKYGILPFVAMLGIVVALLMMQPHLSGTLIICFLCVVLLFIGGTKILHLLITGAIGVAGLAAIVVYKLTVQGYGYYAVRIQSWLDPFSDIQGDTWQTCQSLIAIGSGGLFGLGLGESRQKYLYLPESKNDFVFSIVCEELGFVGAMTVILLFILLIFRGLYIASKATDKFGMLIAVGFTFHIGIQAFLNIAVVSNLIMNTGISLPFFSYGGTALILQLCEMGVVLNISRTRYKLPPKRKKKVTENVADYTPEEKLDA
jgi:cell division protein FtsW